MKLDTKKKSGVKNTKTAAKQKSKLSIVRDLLKKNKGKKFRAADISELSGIDATYAAKCLYYLYRNDEAKSEENGLYYA